MTWESIKAWFHHSLTIAWARLVVLVGVLLSFADLVAPVLNTPEIHDMLSNVLDPRIVPFVIIAIGLVTELARRRSLSHPDEGQP